MLHPVFTKLVAELHKLDHLSLISSILKQYSERYLETNSDDFDGLVSGAKEALKKVMEPH